MGWEAVTQYTGQKERMAKKWQRQQEIEEEENRKKIIEREKERLRHEANEIEMQRNLWLQSKEMEGEPSKIIKCVLTEGRSGTDTNMEEMMHDAYQDLRLAAPVSEITIMKAGDVPTISRNDNTNNLAINQLGMEYLMPMTLMGLENKLPLEVFDDEYSVELIRAFAIHELFGSYPYFEILDDYSLWINKKTLAQWRWISYISDQLYNDILNELDSLFGQYRLVMSERYTTSKESDLDSDLTSSVYNL